MMITPRMALGVLWLVAIWFPVAAAPDDDFARGVAEFRAQQYSAALEYFNAAHDAGLRAPALHYNLGVTHFHLGRLSESYQAFSRIGDDADWGPLAHYSMGLVSERQGRNATAQDHFQIAYDRADSPRLRQLAAVRFRDYGAPSGPRSADAGWLGAFSLGSGYEDNVLLSDDDTSLGFSDDGDYFVEAFGSAGKFLTGDVDDGWRMDLGGYYRGYRELDEFNVGVASAGLAHHRRAGSWHVQLGSKVDLQFAGDAGFATVPGLRLQMTHAWDELRLRIRSDLNYVDGASRFEYLTGWQSRSSIDGSLRRGTRFVRAGYELELNDRDDLASGEETFSYSPTRHRLFVAAGVSLSPRIELDARAEYRWSRYADHNVRLDANDNAVQEPKRSEDRLTMRMRLAFRPADNWDTFAEYQYTDNDANVDRYRYDNQQLMIGVSRYF